MHPQKLARQLCHRNIFGLVVAAIMLSLLCSPTAAQNSISITCPPTNQNPLNCGPDNLVSGDGIVNDGDVNTDYSFHFQQSTSNQDRNSEAAYSAGVIGLRTQLSGIWSGFLVTATSGTTFRLDDLIISGPGDSVDTSLNLHMSGNVILSLSAGTSVNVIAGVTLTFAATVDGDKNTGTYGRQVSKTGSGPTNTVDTIKRLGNQLAGGGFSSTFVATVITPTTSVPVGQAFTVVLEFDLGSEGGSVGGGFTHAEFNALNTFGFASGSPVFNLPEGYTVNSASGLIVDNLFNEHVFSDSFE